MDHGIPRMTSFYLRVILLILKVLQKEKLSLSTSKTTSGNSAKRPIIFRKMKQRYSTKSVSALWMEIMLTTCFKCGFSILFLNLSEISKEKTLKQQVSFMIICNLMETHNALLTLIWKLSLLIQQIQHLIFTILI